jgi:hypothetical protein
VAISACTASSHWRDTSSAPCTMRQCVPSPLYAAGCPR